MIGVGRGKNKLLMESDFVRRSSRRQKVRGEREFIVNSDMMLRDFKVKVMSSDRRRRWSVLVVGFLLRWKW